MKNLLEKVKKSIGMNEVKVEITPTILMDSMLKIGSKHEKHYRPNEDYMAASMVGKKPQVFIGIVSDGCSNGAKTDFGARIICQSLRRIIFQRYLIAKTTAKKANDLQEPNFKDLLKGIDSELEDKIQAIRSTKEWGADDFAATVVISLISTTQCYIKIIGDGVIGVRKKNGSIMVSNFDWTLNSPYYKFQDLEPTAHDTFINNFKVEYDKDQEKQLAKNPYHVRQEFDKDHLLRIHTNVSLERNIVPETFLFSEPATEDFMALFNKYINFGKTKHPGFVYPDDELLLIDEEIELENDKKAEFKKKEPQFNESAPEKPETLNPLEEPIEPEKPIHPMLKELVREDFKTEQAWGYEKRKRNDEIYRRKKEVKAYDKKKSEYDDALLGFTRLKIQHQRKVTSFNNLMNKYNKQLLRFQKRKEKFDDKYEQYQIGASEYDQRIFNLQKSKNEFIRLKLRHLEILSTKEFYGLYEDPHSCHKSNMKWLELYKKHKREKFLPKEVRDRLQANISRLEKAITLEGRLKQVQEYLQLFSPFKSEKILGIKYSEVVPIKDAFHGQEYFFDANEMKKIEAIGIFTDGIADLSKVKLLEAVHFMLTYRQKDIIKDEKNEKSTNRTHFARKKFSNLLSKTVPRDDFASVIYVLDDMTPYIPISKPTKK